MIQQSHKLVELLRENMRLRAEIEALVNILDVTEMTGQLPADWRSDLKERRQTGPYRNISEQYEPLLKEIEESGDEVNWDKILLSIPAAQLVE